MNRFFTIMLLAGFLGMATSGTAQVNTCPFTILYSANGLTVEAQLVSPIPVLPPTDNQWFVDGNSQPIGTGAQVVYTVPTPGVYYLCAVYSWNGISCTTCNWETIEVGEGCEDACYFQIHYELDGVQFHAWLQSDPVDPQLPDPIKWILDGEVQGTGEKFVHLFTKPGEHVLCASYEVWTRCFTNMHSLACTPSVWRSAILRAPARIPIA